MSGDNAGRVARVDPIDRRHLVEFLERALAYPSPQTERLEADPQMAAFLRDVVTPEARALAPESLRVDAMGMM